MKKYTLPLCVLALSFSTNSKNSLPSFVSKTSFTSPWRVDSPYRSFSDEDTSVQLRLKVMRNRAENTLARRLREKIINEARYYENFKHTLVYGDGETNKKALVERLIQEIDQEIELDYVYFSAINLTKYRLADGVDQLKRLFDFAHNYQKWLVIFIDDIERFNNDTLLASLFNYMSTHQKKYVVVGLSNWKKGIDQVLSSKFSSKLFLGYPDWNAQRLLYGED